MDFHRALLFTCWLLAGLAFGAGNVSAQEKADTLRFTLHYPENAFEVSGSLSAQIDSVLAPYGFNDPELETKIGYLGVYGHTDNTGPAKKNKKLSEARAKEVITYLEEAYNKTYGVLLGLGESKPLADNRSAEGRARNRRVDVVLTYRQKEVQPKEARRLREARDTLIVYEDGTKLRMRVSDFMKVSHCIVYKRDARPFDVFQGLAYSNQSSQFYILGNITLYWCDKDCFSSDLVMSLPLPDAVVKRYFYQVRAFLKEQRVNARIKKHTDNKWYIDVKTNCPVLFNNWTINCGRPPKMKKVRFKAKDGYKIVSYALSGGYYSYMGHLKTPRRRVKFKVPCAYELPELTVTAIRNKNYDTLYYASGTEKHIPFKKRLRGCKTYYALKDGEFKFIRLLRRKYSFRHRNFTQKVVTHLKRPEDEGINFSR